MLRPFRRCVQLHSCLLSCADTPYALFFVLPRRLVTAVPRADVRKPGDYILCFDAHFVAVRHREEDGLQINQTNRSHVWLDMDVCDQHVAPLAQCPKTQKMLLNLNFVDGVFKIETFEEQGHVDFHRAMDRSGGSGMPPPGSSKSGGAVLCSV